MFYSPLSTFQLSTTSVLIFIIVFTLTALVTAYIQLQKQFQKAISQPIQQLINRMQSLRLEEDDADTRLDCRNESVYDSALRSPEKLLHLTR